MKNYFLYNSWKFHDDMQIKYFLNLTVSYFHAIENKKEVCEIIIIF